MMNREFDLIIFDWDGTLMDSVAKIVRCFQEAMNELNISSPSVDEIRNIIGLGMEEAMNILLPNHSSAEKNKVIDVYRDHFLERDKTDMPFFSGVESGLQQLQSHGYQLAVATGKNRKGLDRLLGLHDFDKYFTATRCSDESCSKPNPKMIHDLLSQTKIAPEKAIMIGDSTYDMEMACNAKIECIAVNYGVHDCQQLKQYKPKDCLDSFSDVMNWLT